MRPLEGVRELRERRMLSQQELADLAGVSLFTVQRIERGEGSVRPKTGRAIAGALGVTVEDLLPKEPAPPSSEPTFNHVLEEERRVRYLRTWREYVTELGERWESNIEAGATDWSKEPAAAALLLLRKLLDAGVLGQVYDRMRDLPPDEFSELLQLGAAVHNLSEIAESIPATEEQAEELRRTFRLIEGGAA